MQTNKLQSLDTSDLKNIDGGIVPIVIGGLYLSGKALLAIGLVTGAAVAIATKN